ncbi:MAG TPA: RNA methyltransferase [Thermomicrobiaceae bacterium]|nr:RNA methyltransferase [Thermomicrobiaceae bacterium]
MHQRKIRYRERALLVEGVRLFLDAVGSGAQPTHVFVDEERLGSQTSRVRAAAGGARTYSVTSSVLDAIAETRTPQGVVAIFPFPELPLELPPGRAPLIIVSDSLQDPGNLGTLARSALGAGATALLLTSATVDPYAPKVVRAGMGAQFRLPIRWLDWNEPDPLLLACEHRLCARADAVTVYTQIDWTLPSCVVIGNEVRGISPQAEALLTGSIAVPLAGGLESLNAGVAGSVILFEAARQRRAIRT